MKLYTAASTMAMAAGVHALPSQIRAATAACSAAVTLDATTNVFASYALHANNFYRAEVEAAVANLTDTSLATKAAAVADIGSFLWLDTIANIARLEPGIADVPCEEILGVVIYDLPGRDCNAKASNGELATGELEKYKTTYIDPIATILKANPNTAFALVIEPDSLPNLVTNIDNPLCLAAESDYKAGVAYALETLNLPNVVMYMDAGHGGWLGWNDNLAPGAEMLAGVYKDAGSPSQLRGISTNVAGWNSWDGPAEFADGDGQYNKAQNEKLYVGLIGAALSTAGMPNHAIVDTSRQGVQGIRLEWGDWCNVNGSGFGLRPSSETGDDLTDAFVWVKAGGESDGTSDTTAVRYDSFCGLADAFKPAPEAGTWNQAFFEMLVKNANPAL